MASGSRLKCDDVAAQMSKSVRQHARSDERLQTHVTDPHAFVSLTLRIAPPILLHDQRRRPHPEESSPVNPPADVALQYQDLARQHAIALLFEEQIVSILEKDLGVSKLVIRPT